MWHKDEQIVWLKKLKYYSGIVHCVYMLRWTLSNSCLKWRRGIKSKNRKTVNNIWKTAFLYTWLLRVHVDSTETKKMQNDLNVKRAKGVVAKIRDVFISWLV